MDTIEIIVMATIIIGIIIGTVAYETLNNKIISAESNITDKIKSQHKEIIYSISVDTEAITKALSGLEPRLKRIESSLYTPLYDKGQKVYFKDNGKEKWGIITNVFAFDSQQASYNVNVGKQIIRILQEEITAWE